MYSAHATGASAEVCNQCASGLDETAVLITVHGVFFSKLSSHGCAASSIAVMSHIWVPQSASGQSTG